MSVSAVVCILKAAARARFFPEMRCAESFVARLLNAFGRGKVACVVSAAFARADVAFCGKLLVGGFYGYQADTQVFGQVALRRQLFTRGDGAVCDVVANAAVEVFIKAAITAQIHVVKEHLFAILSRSVSRGTSGHIKMTSFGHTTITRCGVSFEHTTYLEKE